MENHANEVVTENNPKWSPLICFYKHQWTTHFQPLCWLYMFNQACHPLIPLGRVQNWVLLQVSQQVPSWISKKYFSSIRRVAENTNSCCSTRKLHSKLRDQWSQSLWRNRHCRKIVKGTQKLWNLKMEPVMCHWWNCCFFHHYIYKNGTRKQKVS